MFSDHKLEISPENLHKKLLAKEDFILLDVRGKQKYQEWTIFNSINIPILQLMEAKEFPEEFKHKEIITICGRGNDSKFAAKKLQDNGFKALSLSGGLTLWNTIYDQISLKIEDSDFTVTQFRRIAKGCLSYIITNGGNEAIIVDPGSNIQPYVDFLEKRGLGVEAVIDTHMHADHISGARKLAEEVDTKLLLPEIDAFQYDHTKLRNNEVILLGGKPIITAIHTPGHTKGSTSLKIKNFGILTGDIAFVDGIGRPDLHDKVNEYASDLYDTIHTKLLQLPENMFIGPAHHGKFKLSHFGQPIITSIEKIKKFEIVKKSKEDFINYAIERVRETPHPPSYQSIVQINRQGLSISPQELTELESGPNNCAIG